MKIKQFLKPDWRKIVIFMILFSLSIFLSYSFSLRPISGPWGWVQPTEIGFPFEFYFSGSADFIPPYTKITEFKTIQLIADILFLYIFSCLIVWVYDNFRKKKK